MVNYLKGKMILPALVIFPKNFVLNTLSIYIKYNGKTTSCWRIISNKNISIMLGCNFFCKK